jgi:hypothetical protein
MNLRGGIILSLLFILIFLWQRNWSNIDPNIHELKNKTPDKRVKAQDVLNASTTPNLNLDRIIDRAQLIEHYNLNDTRKKNIFYSFIRT